MAHTVAKTQLNMTEGPVLGKMIRFALPVMATGVLQLLFNTADVAVAGRFSGETAVAAVGCCTALINLIVNLFIGLSVGAGVVAAQDLGAKRYDDVARLIRTSLTASLVGGVIVGILGFLLTEPLLILMETPDEVLPESVKYMKAYFFGMPGCLVYNYMAAILRSAGDTKRPLLFLATSGVANVGMNLLMVLGFGLGAMGVGIATAISQYVAAGMTIVYMVRTNGYCRLTGFGVDSRKLSRLVLIGLPAGIQGCLFSLSNVLIQSNINGYGPTVVAGNTAAMNLDGYIYTAMNAVYQTVLTFVGQNVGAGKYRRIKKIALQAVGMVIVVGLFLGGVLMLFGDVLLQIFISDDGVNRDAVIAAGVDRLWVMGAFYFLCGLMEVGCGILRGMGKAIQPMIVSLLGSCAFRIAWVYTVCPLFPHNIYALYISYPISWVLTAAVHFLFVFIFYRKFTKETSIS